MGRKVVLVTGGSRGIGAETAVQLAESGWDVAITFAARKDSAESVQERCQQAGSRCLPIQLDLSVSERIGEVFAHVQRALGPISALVNNAGIVAPKSSVAAMSSDRIRHMMNVNVVGPFVAAGEAVRRMSATGLGGAIVNVSSIAARLGSPGEYVDYAASKGAIDSMTVGLAKEVAEQGIRVNAVRLGTFDTELHASGGQPDRASRVAAAIPIGRPGRPGEAAAAITWLCSDAASYVSGAILDISGGR